MEDLILKCPACGRSLKVNKTAADGVLVCPNPNCNYRDHISRFTKVQLKRVQCRNCRKGVITIDANHTGNLTCQNCKNTDDVLNYFEMKETVGNKQNTEFQTIISPKKQQEKLSVIGALRLVEGECNTEIVKLKPGINTIGRKAASSDSNIQLDSSDKYMGRKHVNIEVVTKSDNSIEHYLSDADSKNGTMHNNEKMFPEDIIILTTDDLITIGKTTFQFVIEKS